MHTHAHRLLPARLRFITDAGDGGGDGGTDNGDGGTGGESTYMPPATQADLDRIIDGRLARERKKYEGFDDLKSKAEKWDAHEASQNGGDKEKPSGDSGQSADDAKKAGEAEATQRFLKRIVSTEVRSEAKALGFHDPDDALRVIDEANLPVKDEEADTEAIQALVKKLAEDKPHLVATTRRRAGERPRERQGESTDGDGKSKGSASAALRQLAKSRKSGS